LLFQIAVAIYVFHKSWSGDKRLFQAAIIIFVIGIIKCLEKPWALRCASISSLIKTAWPVMIRMLFFMRMFAARNAGVVSFCG